MKLVCLMIKHCQGQGHSHVFNTLLNLWPLWFTVVVEFHLNDRYVGNHGRVLENLSIVFNNKTFGHELSVSPCYHLNSLTVDAVDFLFPFVVTFLDGLFVALLVGLIDGFGLLKCFADGTLSFHEGQVCALCELQLAWVSCYAILAFCVH